MKNLIYGGAVQRPLLGIVAGAMAIAIAVAVGLAVHGGSLAVFVAFSLVFFSIAFVAICNPRDYAHLFLAAMWLMGFWGRYVIHQAKETPYVEAVGDFSATPASIDAVLTVCTLGGLGFLIGRLATLPISTSLKNRWRLEQLGSPAWYGAWRGTLWAIALIAIIAIVAVNWRFGILVRGSVAQTLLPWPLGGLFAWTTDIGLALALAILTAWDRQCGLGVVRGFVFLCIEGAAMSLSTASRALYLFHTLPFFVSEVVGRPLAARRRLLLGIFAIWLAGAAAVPATTTFFRLFGSEPVPTQQGELDAGYVRRQDFNLPVLRGQGATLAWLLVVERWTGLEGVMATVAYADKGYGLMWRAAFDRRSYGTVDVYTRDISKSGFSERHAGQYHYATPAGSIAFLYFSGSLWIVVVGMALIAVLMTAIELAWRRLIRDELPLAIAGWYLAFIVLQLSGSLQQAVVGPVMVTLLFGAAWLMSAFSRSTPAGASA
jgi:hypothetical protein